MKEIIRRCLLVTAFLAVVYIGIVGTILLMHHLKMSSLSPLDFTELEQMKEQLRDGEGSETLREKIRSIDLVLRRNWFLGQEFSHKGKKLLFWAVFIFVFCLIANNSLRDKVAPPAGPVTEEESARTKELSAIGFIGLTSLALSLLVFSLGKEKTIVPGTNKNEPAVKAAAKVEIKDEDFLKNWPNFRGLHNTGVVAHLRPVLNWDGPSNKGIVWKTKVDPKGFSSLVIWQEKLFLTGGDDKERALFCLDAKTGKLLWKETTKSIPGSPPQLPEVSGDTGFAASTAATDGQSVYAIFATGNLLCTDLDGNRRWAKNLGVPENIYGYSSSLLALNGRVIVQYDNDKKKQLFCFEGLSGKQLWEKTRDTKNSWASPALVTMGSKEIVVVATSRHVQAYAVTNGDELWSVRCLGGEVAPSPTFDGKNVYVACDGANAAAIDVATGKLLWKSDDAVLPDVSSPVVTKVGFYLFGSSGTVSCLDCKSGELLWEKDLKEGFYSSPLLLGEEIIVFNRKGDMLLIEPSKEKLIVKETLHLGESVVTTPAVLGNQMWLRGYENIYCLTNGSK